MVDGNKESIKLSIIVPCYNVAKYVEKSVDSVVEQSGFSECELILVDDGSTDGTFDLLKSKFYSRANVYVFSNGTNRGVAVTRNRGMKYAKGEYIYFFDADDFLEAESLSLLLTKIENSVDMISFGFKINAGKLIRHESYPKVHNRVFGGKDFLKNYFKRTILQHMCSFVVRRDIIVSNNIQFVPNTFYAEDQEFQMKCQYYSRNVLYLKDELFHYIRRDTSVMSKPFSEKHLTAFDVFERMISYFEKDKEIFRFYKSYALFNFYDGLRHLVKSGGIGRYDYGARARRLLSLRATWTGWNRVSITSNMLNVVQRLNLRLLLTLFRVL